METFSIGTSQVRFYLKCQLQMKSSEESSKASSEDTSESKEDNNSIARERNFLIQTEGKARLTFWTVWEVNKENKGKEWWIQRHTHISQFCEKIAARLPVCIQAPTVLPCVNSLLWAENDSWIRQERRQDIFREPRSAVRGAYFYTCKGSTEEMEQIPPGICLLWTQSDQLVACDQMKLSCRRETCYYNTLWR